MSKKPFKIFSGRYSRYLADEIARKLGVEVGEMQVNVFADGEFQVSYEESVRGDEIYLVQSMFPPTDNLMELLLMIDAAKRASAKSVTAVIPYFGWARQDRKDRPRVSIAAKLVAGMLTSAGVDSIITMDLHAAQIQGFFNIPTDHLKGTPILVDYFREHNSPDLVIVSPDHGSVKRARDMAQPLGAPIAIIDKRRPRPNVSEIMNIIGDIEGKDCILIDDMVDTAGTICNAANALKERGAKSVRACATHGVLSGPAIERIQASAIEEMVFLNTIEVPEEKMIDKFTVISVAPIFAETIRRVYTNEPVSPLFD